MRLLRFLLEQFNNLKLRWKIIGLFLFCVIIPLTVTDGMILTRIIAIEEADERYQAEETAALAANMLVDIGTSCEKISTSIDLNRNIEEFLGADYINTYEFFTKYYEMIDNSYFKTLVGFSDTKVTLYSSNPTMNRGGYVGRVDTVIDTAWYQEYMQNKCDKTIVTYYDKDKTAFESKRKLYYIAPIHVSQSPYQNFALVEVNYNSIVSQIRGLGRDSRIVICNRGQVLADSAGGNIIGDPFAKSNIHMKDVMASKDVSMYNNTFSVYVLKQESSVMEYLLNNWKVILVLIVFNIGVPGIFIFLLNYSIVNRISKMENAFAEDYEGELKKIDKPDGNDEIGMLMNAYNLMVDRINELIQIVYKNKMKEQEMSIAKKNAELLALHSQINPHFMFNALESIRMHSVLKGEDETARMVEKLALMERRYVEWDSDCVKIEQEMNSVMAYLELQKYRFGDRLMYELSVDDEYKNANVPKLTIVTFVENACVHGMESKSGSCYVFVRVYGKDDNIIIEVEDTGNGISEEQLEDIRQKASNMDIDDLKTMKHVGIFNAILRLRMFTDESACFNIESEEGIGTIVTITLPKEGLR